MGGGGANSLTSPETADNSDFEGDKKDPKKEGGETTWTTPTYKSYEDYFVDFDIKAETITELDLTGDGSVTNPYVVHSTRGFLWLTSNDKSNISLRSKYMELACDIVLNDERFDENGTPSGGDGVVYLWKPIAYALATKLTIDGKGYSIYGAYFNDITVSGMYIFSSRLLSVRNLNIKNLFFQAEKEVSTISSLVENIENCTTSGTIKATNQVGGVCLYAGKKIKNTNNFVNIFSSNCGGIFYAMGNDTIVDRVNNYGNIYGNGNLGGIVYYCGEGNSLKMTNTNNYGDVINDTTSVSYGAGGLVSAIINSAKAEIFNCANYGNVYRRYSSDTAGGLVGQCHSKATLTISECKSFRNGKKANCAPIFGGATSANCVIVKNCEIITTNSHQSNLLYTTSSAENLHFKNIKIKVLGSGGGYKLGWGFHGKRLVFDNILIEADFNISSNFYIIYSGYKEKVEISGIVAKVTTNSMKNFYIGTDFSGFYTDWKTGKIGLKALSGKGFYQGCLTEEILINKGFEKKVI